MKLLFSTIASLLLLITFLNFSLIVLFKEDKRAYVYQSQSNEIRLAAREFYRNILHTLDTIKSGLGIIDPSKPLTEQQRATLQAWTDNQSDIIYFDVFFLDTTQGKLNSIVRTKKLASQEARELPESYFEIAPENIPGITSELSDQSYSLINLSKIDGAPLLGVLVGDLKSRNATGFTAALGVMSLKDFIKMQAGDSLTVATLSGHVLFDSDPAKLYVEKDVSNNPLYKLSVSNKAPNGVNEFNLDDKKYLGTYLRPGLDLTVLAKTEWTTAMKATYLLVEKFVLLGIMAISAAVIYALMFARTLTNPLEILYQGTAEIEKGNFDLDLKISSRDELGVLTGAFNRMSHKIRELMQEWIKKVQLEQEVAIASTVQQTLIPEPRFLDEKVYVRSHYQPAAECGGDWWGMFHDHSKLCVMIADATGHGLPSALITAAARGYFSVMSKIALDNPEFPFTPSSMLSIANRVVFEASLGKIQMTFFIGVIDFQQMTLKYCSGGHTPAWLYRKTGDEYKQKSLIASGARLGEGPNLIPPEEKTVEIKADDIIIVYTDGILEGTNKEGTMYGKKRFKQIVDSAITDGPDAVVDKLMADFMSHNESKPLDDDVTLAVIKLLNYTPPKT